ncbi:MAG: hypothetical protein Tsb002_21340 [Wenzhouxiangellaceae bacterium]
MYSTLFLKSHFHASWKFTSLFIIFYALFFSAQTSASFTNVISNSPNLNGYRAGAGDNHGPGGSFVDLNNDGYADLALPRGPNSGPQIYRNVASGSTRTFVLHTTLPASATGSTGVIAGDYDNDGDLDLYVLHHSRNSHAGGGQCATFSTEIPSPNKLFRNNLIPSGSLTFTDVTASTVPLRGGSGPQLGLATAIENGIELDNSLSAAWADVDRDGDLDLYVANHNGFGCTWEETPTDPTHPRSNRPGQRDILYLNNGNGKFTDVTNTYGVWGYENTAGNGITGAQWFSSSNAVIFSDLNNDGWPDLFVSNKVGSQGSLNTDADMTYYNLGNNAQGQWQGFDNRTYSLTINNQFGFKSGAAMGVDAGDYDNDGDMDLYLTDFVGPVCPGCALPYNDDLPGTNDLYTNNNGASFTWDGSGATAGGFSWGTNWFDVDNNGRLDLHVATAGSWEDYLYMQTSPGVFVDQAALQGVNQMRDARGDLTADYDLDGDTDLFVINLGNIPSVLYNNQIAAGTGNRHFLRLKLNGNPALIPAPHRSSRDAIGARVRVTANTGSGMVTQTREVRSGSGNAASTNELALTFGLGSATSATVDILWPSGRSYSFTAPADLALTVNEPNQVIGLPGQTPYLGTPHTIPGRIEAEHYDNGGPSIAYHDTTAGNVFNAFRNNEDVDVGNILDGMGGRHIGFLANGEWVEYTVNVQTSAYYDITLRAATPTTSASFHLELNGATVGGAQTITNTCDWHHYVRKTIRRVWLSAGNNKILKLAFDSGSWNVDWLDIRPAAFRSATSQQKIGDTFACVTQGGSLNGRVTETGALSWFGNGTVFADRDDVTGNITHPIASLPFNLPNLGNKPAVVEANIDPRGAGWIGIGFTEFQNHGWWADGEIWVWLNPQGNYAVLANGTSQVLKASTPAIGFNSNGFNHVQLRYNPAARQAELWINGIQQMPWTTVPGGYVPKVFRAGFQIFSGTQNQSRVDDYSVWLQN